MSSTLKHRPVLIAALRREIAGLVRGWETDDVSAKRGVYLYWNEQAIVACAGMGGRRAALAVEAALALGPATELVSIGWAGGCSTALGVGDLLYPSVVIDARTGERHFVQKPQNAESVVLVTVASPAGVREKQRVAESYSASAIDMEAAAVARIASARDLPFRAIKAISDEATFELPDMSRFTKSNGQLREAAFGLHVAMRPTLWRPVLKLAKGSKLAGERLQAAIREEFAGRFENGDSTPLSEQ